MFYDKQNDLVVNVVIYIPSRWTLFAILKFWYSLLHYVHGHLSKNMSQILNSQLVLTYTSLTTLFCSIEGYFKMVPLPLSSSFTIFTHEVTHAVGSHFEVSHDLRLVLKRYWVFVLKFSRKILHFHCRLHKKLKPSDFFIPFNWHKKTCWKCLHQDGCRWHASIFLRGVDGLTVRWMKEFWNSTMSPSRSTKLNDLRE